MKAAAVIFGVILTVFAPCGYSQGDAPSQPPIDKPDKPDKPNRDHTHGSRPGFGGSGGSGMMSHGDREHFDIFKDMPEEQKQKVRAAFEKAWKNPGVTEARERLMAANEEYRKILQKALAEADPEVVKILENRKPSMGPGGPGMMGKMPDASDPDFANKVLQRLKMESPQGDHRESPMSRMHEKVMQAPAVVDAVKQLQQAEPAKRMEAWEKLREVYQTTIKSEFAKLRDNFRKDGSGSRDSKNGVDTSIEEQKQK